MSTFFTFLVLSLLYCAAPGPTMLMVINTGLSSPEKKRVFSCVAGILVSNFTMVVLISFGLGTVIKDSQYIVQFIACAGALYLFYLGVQSFVNSFKQSASSRNNEKSRNLPFVKGFLTSITNPKLSLFYVAFLPQFFTGTYEYNIELFLWGLFYISIVFFVMSAYGIMAATFARYLFGESTRKITAVS